MENRQRWNLVDARSMRSSARLESSTSSAVRFVPARGGAPSELKPVDGAAEALVEGPADADAEGEANANAEGEADIEGADGGIAKRPDMSPALDERRRRSEGGTLGPDDRGASSLALAGALPLLRRMLILDGKAIEVEVVK